MRNQLVMGSNGVVKDPDAMEVEGTSASNPTADKVSRIEHADHMALVTDVRFVLRVAHHCLTKPLHWRLRATTTY